MPTSPRHQNALQSVTLQAGGMNFEGFSISGVATYFRVAELDVMFDVGECPIDMVPVNAVFLTHAHGDHSRCLLRHWQLRNMFNLPGEATYYVPENTVPGFRKIVQAEAEMEGIRAQPHQLKYPNLVGVTSGTERFKLAHRKDLWARAFAVRHRAPSLGYTIGRTVQKLRPEYAHLEGREIGALRKSGTVVTDTVDTPLVTFIGDCTGRSLGEETHIWDSKVVVIECTYVEDEDRDAALDHQHTHLREIVEVLNRNPAPACEALILKHFSLKYNPERVHELIWEQIPENWRDRVQILLPLPRGPR